MGNRKDAKIELGHELINIYTIVHGNAGRAARTYDNLKNGLNR